MPKRKTSRCKSVSRLCVEALEPRRMLATNATTFYELALLRQLEGVQSLSVQPAELIQVVQRIDFAQSSRIDQVYFENLNNSLGLPVVVAGSPTGVPPDSPAKRVDPNSGPSSQYGGVVSLLISYSDFPFPFICSGSVVAPTYVLTAGHCFDANGDGALDATITGVVAHLNNGSDLSSTHNNAPGGLTVHPSFQGFNIALPNDDIALLKLDTPVPPGTPIYKINTAGMTGDTATTTATTVTLVGYGLTGTGDVGYDPPGTNDPDISVKRWGKNNTDLFSVDDDGGGQNEVYEFDFDGAGAFNLIGGTTLGNDIESNLGGGDSGGPAFVEVDGELQIAGVNTYVRTLLTSIPIGKFATLGGGMITAAYNSWINEHIGVDLELSTVQLSGGNAGEDLVFEVTVTNAGPNDATGVTIANTVSNPPGATPIFTPSGATSHSGTTWSVGDLDSGSSETLRLRIPVGSSVTSGTSISTTSSIASVVEPETDPSDDSSTLSKSITRAIDIAVTQSVVDGEIIAGAGGVHTFTIMATNSGPSDASNVKIDTSLILPSGVTASFNAINGSHSGSTWTIPSLASGGSPASIQVTLTPASSATAGATAVSDPKFISANEVDTRPSNNEPSNVISTITRAIDIALTQSLAPGAAQILAGGGNIHAFTITVMNNGPSDATNVFVDTTIDLPTSQGVIASFTPSGTTSHSGSTWSVGSLASGGSATLQVALNVPLSAVAGAVITSDPSFASAAETDINPANNEPADLISTITANTVDIAVTQVREPGASQITAGSGGVHVFTITAKNNGPLTASNVLIDTTQILPAGVTASYSPASGTHSVGTSTWTIPTLAANASTTLDVTLTPTANAAAGATVTSDPSFISANEADNNAANNTPADLMTTVVRSIDIAVTQIEQALVDPIIAGAAGVHTYTITARNNGPSNASGVVVGTPINLPGGQGVVVAYNPSAGTTHSGSTWTIGNLASGGTATLQVSLTAPASAAAGSTISSTPSFTTANEADFNASNNAPASLATSIARRVDIELTQMELIDPLITGSGSTPTYKITAKNNGPSDASGLKVNLSLSPYTGVTASYSPNKGSVAGSMWTLGNLLAGDSGTMDVNLTVGATATPGTDVITSAPTVSAVNEVDTNSSNESPIDSTSIDSVVPPTVRIGGSSWAANNVDLYRLDSSQNPILPWFLMNTVQVVYPTAKTTPPPFLIEGPTNGSTVPAEMSAAISTVGTRTFNYSFPPLSDGYYRVTVDGVSYRFGVLRGDSDGKLGVNIIDFTIFAGAYAPGVYTGPAPHFADYNGNGQVEIVDFTLFAASYLNDLSAFAAPASVALRPIPVRSGAVASTSRVVDNVFAALVDADDDEKDEDETLMNPRRLGSA